MLTRIFAALVFLTATAASHAAEEVWRRLVDDQTLLVATASLPEMAPPAVADGLTRYSAELAGEADRVIQALRGMGVVDATLVLGVPDLQTMSGAVVAIGLAEGANAADAAAGLDKLFAGSGWPRDTPHSLKIQHADGLLLVGSQRTLDRYTAESRGAVRREDLAVALDEVRSSKPAIAVVLSPGQDARRVIRELWPSMKKPWEALTGDLIADARHASATLSLDPLELRLSVTGQDADAAPQWKQLALAGVSMLDGLLTPWRDAGNEATPLSRAFPPKVDGPSVGLTIRSGSPVADELLGVVLPSAYHQAVEQTLMQKRIQKVKNLSFAMHSYHDRSGSFPAMAAVRDPDGKPLLSWRVALLPYLEAGGGDLWRRFKLDEPWDSPHNLDLVKEMPDVFCNPGRPDLNRQGFTVYQVPVGPRTIFPVAPDAELVQKGEATLAKGLAFRDVTDGTSNTLVIVEVAPEHAVPWTKPADWQVDEADPLAMLRQQGRSSFAAARADGSVKPVPIEVPPAELLKALTRNGEENLDRSQW